MMRVVSNSYAIPGHSLYVHCRKGWPSTLSTKSLNIVHLSAIKRSLCEERREDSCGIISRLCYIVLRWPEHLSLSESPCRVLLPHDSPKRSHSLCSCWRCCGTSSCQFTGRSSNDTTVAGEEHTDRSCSDDPSNGIDMPHNGTQQEQLRPFRMQDVKTSILQQAVSPRGQTELVPGRTPYLPLQQAVSHWL